MKKCFKCKISKELNQFHKDKSKTDGLGSKCKQCMVEYDFLNKQKLEYQHGYNIINKSNI